MDVLITAKQVGLWLQLSQGNVRAMARNGQIPSVSLPNDEIRFERAAVEIWLAERTRGNAVAILTA